MDQAAIISQIFKQQFKCDPEVVCYAPGRVNLLGDHTDYNDGFVLPAAIDVGTTIAASRRDDSKVVAFAEGYSTEVDCFSLENITFSQTEMWRNYVRGTLKCLRETNSDFGGVNLAITGNVPQGAGLSSSASFEMAILKTIVDLYQLELEGVTAALLGQRAENEFVGCNCGIMDQLVSSLGLEGHAMLLDCRSLTYEDAPIPAGMVILVVNSNVQRGLVDSEYNARRQQCEEVARVLDVRALRDVSLEQLNEAGNLSEEQYRRARHVITENARTVAAMTAMQASDIKTLGSLMGQSHDSLRDDYEVTTKELDGLVSIIKGVIGDAGGVRMTGGGFGGCVVALIPADLESAVIAAVGVQYSSQFGLEAEVYRCMASTGAFRLINRN
ncbi:galactokinase [Gammaproteobacteria bacterium]|nr:galactokinase [Gammaproteobacteria bacterium]